MINLIIDAAIKAGQAIMTVYTHPDTDWQVEHKADNSPLTLADRRSHQVIAEMLAPTNIPMLSEEGALMPYETRKSWKRMWIVDPLDGTKEFLKRNDEFTVNIALIENEKPTMGVVYAPAKHLLYYGVVGKGAYAATVSENNVIENVRVLPRMADFEERPYRVVASRSHLSPATEAFVDNLRTSHPDLELVSAGSSLKICMVAEGKADIYPRLAPTMEWDTAAGHAVCAAAGKSIVNATSHTPLLYNKEDLHNPFFIVK